MHLFAIRSTVQHKIMTLYPDIRCAYKEQKSILVAVFSRVEKSACVYKVKLTIAGAGIGGALLWGQDRRWATDTGAAGAAFLPAQGCYERAEWLMKHH